jgi:adenine-specific DNA-methyltransferase
MNFIQNESATKLRGGYYTDFDIARFLTRWVLEISPTTILEPSCGDGVFLHALTEAAPGSLKLVKAFEINEAEANKAAEKARALTQVQTEISNTDFIEWAFLNLSRPLDTDAVLGNPPFIRYQYLDDAHQVLMQRVFEKFHLPFTKHTNAWVPFILLSVAHLKAGGRVATVVPSELLHVLHAQSLRDYLAETCSKILIIDPEELWFNGTLQGTVLLLLEKKTGTHAHGYGLAIKTVKERSFLATDPGRIFGTAKYTNGDVVKGKWMSALLTQKERDLLKAVYSHADVHAFADIAKVDVGIVTGANKFFLVPDAVVHEYELEPWAYPMFGRSEHARGVIYDLKTHEGNRRAGLPANFLWFKDTPLSAFPTRVQEYIKNGAAAGLNLRYKCRIRTPWYNVPSVFAAPVGLLKRCHDFPRIILNKAKAFTTDTAYRIEVQPGIKPEDLVFSFVNSLTSLSAELEGRHYGGGVLELVPSEIERLRIPLVKPKASALEKLDREIRRGGAATDILAMQDEAILSELGLDKTDRRSLAEAWKRLRDRRHRVRS